MASEISPRAEVSPKAKIGNNCKIFPFAYIEDNVEIGDGCIIFPFVSILNGTRMGKSNKIHQGAVIGALPQDFNFRGEKSELIMGDNNIVRENVVINRATHTGGQIGNGVIYSSSVIENAGTRVGNGAMIQAGTTFSKDVPPYIIAGGQPVAYGGVNRTMCSAYGISDKVLKHISNAYRLVFHGQTDVFDACRQIEEQVPESEEIQNIVNFIRNTKQGIITKM